MDSHVVFAIISALFGIASYPPYFRDIFKGKTKPHPLSWFVWTLLSGTIFIAQIVKGGGVGAWISGITFFACAAVTVMAITRGEKDISALDWYCLAAGLFGIGLWIITSEAFLAVLIATITNTIMLIPTARKSYWKPYEETLSTWILNTIKWGLSIPSLQTLNWTTALYPASILPVNVLFILMLIIRRRQLSGLSREV